MSSIRQIYESLFEIYKINEETESSLDSASHHAQSNWASLQLSLLKLCLKISETIKALPFFDEVMHITINPLFTLFTC